MNRRDSIKSLAITGGFLASGLCASGCSFFESNNSLFTKKESKLITAIVDTIIPEEEDPDAFGALSLGVDHFLKRLIEKCYEEEVQQMVKLQLATLDQSAREMHGKSFLRCHQAEREDLLVNLKNSDHEEEKEFFDLMKSQTIRAFRTSEEVMVNFLDYQLMPGHYYGCIDVNTVINPI